MADGDNLIIGAPNQGDAVTVLDRNGTQTNGALLVTNTDGDSIHGETSDPKSNCIGVMGSAANGTGMVANGRTGFRARGVQGNGIETDSDRGFGLLARSKNNNGVQATGNQVGVEALALGRDGAAGVRGTAIYGVQGFGSEIGVTGRVTTSAGTRTSAFVGVSGHSNSSYGVFGESTAPRGGPLVAGVAGTSKEVGVVGESTDPNGTGVVGHSPFFVGTSGVARSGIGVIGQSDSGTAIGGTSLTGWAGVFNGSVAITGDFYVFGAIKSAALLDASGHYRKMYCMESPESWLEDFGSAKLVHGHARVRIKADFAQFISARDYHIFLTPEGESNGLYVTRKTKTEFEVVEQQKGSSNIPFSYRIIARRRDLAKQRLEKVAPPKALPRISAEILKPRVPELPPEFKTLIKARRRKPKRAGRA